MERQLKRGSVFMLGCMAAGMVMMASSDVALGSESDSGAAVSRPALESYLMGNVKGLDRAQVDAKRKAIDQELSLQDKIIAQANRLGLTKGKDYEAMLELAKRRIILRRYWADYFSRHPISDAEVKQLYDRLRHANGHYQDRVSEILVKNGDQANKVLDALGKHQSFSDVARKYSIVGSRSRGGDLGWQWKTNFVPQVAQSIRYLRTGEYTSVPISVSGGLLIVRLDATRKQKFPTLDQLRQKLTNVLHTQMQRQEVQRLARAKN